MDDSVTGFAKYVLAVAKLYPDEAEALKLIETRIKEVINFEIQICLDLILSKELSWGETAIRVNAITRDLTKKIKNRLKIDT